MKTISQTGFDECEGGNEREFLKGKSQGQQRQTPPTFHWCQMSSVEIGHLTGGMWPTEWVLLKCFNRQYRLII